MLIDQPDDTGLVFDDWAPVLDEQGTVVDTIYSVFQLEVANLEAQHMLSDDDLTDGDDTSEGTTASSEEGFVYNRAQNVDEFEVEDPEARNKEQRPLLAYERQ